MKPSYKLSNFKGETVSIMVPWDCNNNCPFCVNKSEYFNKNGFSIEEIYKSLILIDNITPECNIVITGGEPLADLDKFEDLLNHIKPNHNIYINTTLPYTSIKNTFDMINMLNKHIDKIKCINISRHLIKYVEECDDEFLKLINIPYRINCVTYDEQNITREMIENFFERFDIIYNWVQFRKDYTDVTKEDIRIEKDDFNLKLENVLNNDKRYMHLTYLVNDTGMNSTRLYKTRENGIENKVTYHKILPYSTDRTDPNIYHLNDIIINQKGIIMDDWSGYGEELNITEYAYAVYKIQNKV